MWKAFTGRSESGSTSGLRRKKSSSSRAGASDAGLSSTPRRDEEGERGHKSSRSAYGEDDGRSSSSVYATAPSSRVGSSSGRGLTESAVRSLGGQGEGWEEDDGGKSEKRSRRGEGSERRHKSSRSEKERSRSREGKERRRESTSQRDSGRDERSQGKSRTRDVGDAPNGERGIPAMGSFEQFPGQYSAALVGPPQSFDSPASGALPSADPMHQFPSQIPRTFTRPQLGPTRAESYGQASEYYMDEGQSVGFQPGHRAGTPNMLVNPTLHLHAASAEPHTALDTGHGSASDFYGGEASSIYHEAVEPMTISTQGPVSGRDPSGSTDRPSKLGEMASTAAAAAATAGVLKAATSSYDQKSSKSYQQNTANSRPQASTSSRSPGRSYTAPGAAGSYYAPAPQQTPLQNGKAEMVGAGLAAAGMAVGANALLNDRKNFDDTYSVKSGHRASSAMRRRSRSSSRERRRRSEHGVIRVEPRQEYVTVRTKDGRVEERQVAQSERFDPRERRDGLMGVAAGAAIGATAASVMERDTRQRRDGQSQGAFVRRHSGSESRGNSPGLGEIFGFSNRKPSRVARRSPNGSYYTAPQRSRRGSEEEVGMLGSFFSPSQNESKRRNGRERPKKQRGFFSLGNGSSASSDDDMAFGGGHASKTSLPIRRKSSRRTARKSSDEHLAATVAGIGITAAALAAAQKGQRPNASSSRPELGPRRDVRVQYEGQHGHGQVDEDGWEDELPSDADDASSTHSALAFGAGSRLPHRQSFESASSADGLSAWGWRWGGKDRRKRRTPSPQNPAYPPRQSGPSFGMVDAGLAAAAVAGVAHDGPGRAFERESAIASMPSVPQQPMQYIDPRPVSEAGSQHDSMPGSYEPSMARPGPAPLQQPQPITPVSPAFVQDAFFDERPQPRRTASSPARGNFGLEDVALIGAGALAAGSIIASQGRKGKESSNVRFGLTDEQKMKEDRQHRRERQEADEERRRADRTRALKEEAERHAKEEDASRREEAVRQRREEENRLAAEAALERQRAEQHETEQQAELDRERGERERREQQDIYEREQRRLADEGRQQEQSRKQWEATAAEEAARDRQARVQREAQIQAEIEAKQRELDEQAAQGGQVDESRLSRQRREEEESSERRRVEQQRLEDERPRGSSGAWAPVAAGAVAAATVGAVLAGSEHGRFREVDQDKQREHDNYPEKQALYHPVADDKPVSYAAKQISPDEQPSGPPIMDDDLYDKDFFSRKRSGSEYSRSAAPTRTTADKVVADMDAYYHRPAVSQAEFFAPKDILSQPSAGKTRVADPYDDNDVHFSQVTDEAPRSYDQWGARSKAAPYGVPSLNVISPTPPPGTNMSAKILAPRPPSPLAQSSPVQNGDAKPSANERPSKRDRTRSISWGQDKTHVYDPPTPESYHEGDSYTHARDARLEEATAAGAALNEIVVEAAEPGTGSKKTAYRAEDLPLGNEPHADAPPMYRQPFHESVPDLGFGRVGIDSPGTKGAPPVRGYVEGETDEPTPLRETPSHMPGAFDDDPYQGDPRGPQERYEVIEPPQAPEVPAAEPEESVWEAPLSKKDKKKRDKSSKRSSAFDSEASAPPTPAPADIPLPSDETAETPRDELSEYASQSDRKVRDKTSKRAEDLDDEPRDLPTPVADWTQSSAYNTAEPPQDEPIEYPTSKKDKKKKDKASKRASTFDEYSEPSTPAPVEAEPSFVTPFETPAEEVDDYFVSKKDKKKKDKASKRGSTFDEYSEPSTPAPVAEAESAFVTPIEAPAEEVDDYFVGKKDKKKKDKASKRASTFDEYSEPSTPAAAESDRTIAEPTEVPLEEPDDYFMSKKDKKKREKASKRGVSEVSSPIVPETDHPEISEDAPSTEVTASEADAPKLSKKEQKKRDKESQFNDFPDIATDRSVDPEIEAEWTPPTKKGKKGKKSKDTERDLRDIEPSDKSSETPAVYEEASAMPGGWGPQTPLEPSDPSQSQTRADPSPDAQEADFFGDFSSAKSKKQKKRRESGRFNEPAASSPLRSEWTHDDYIGPHDATAADQPPSRESTFTAEPAGYTNGNGHGRDVDFSRPDPATAPVSYEDEELGRDRAERRPEHSDGDRGASNAGWQDAALAGTIATSAMAAQAERANEDRTKRGPEYEDDRRRFDDTGRYHSPEDARHGSVAPERAADHDDRRRSSNGKSRSEGRYETEADEVDNRSTAASEPFDDYDGSRKSKHRSRHEDDDTASVASSGSRHVKDESPTAKKEKKGGIFGLFSRKSTETVPLSRQSTHSDEAPLSRTSTRNGDEEDGERKHHRRKHRDGSVRDEDEDDTRSMTSESRHRHHRERDGREVDGEKRRHSSRHGNDEPENRSESGHRHHHHSEHDRDDDTSSRAGSEGSHRHHHHRRRADEEENNSKHHSFLGDRVENMPPLPVSPPESPVSAPVKSEQDDGTPASAELDTHSPTQARSTAFELGGSDRSRDISETNVPAGLGHRESYTQQLNHSAVKDTDELPSTPVSPSSTPKKARPSSTEFRPLYLVERNRKPQEIEETLPSLPSSKPSSRASSVHSSEDWQSAAESPSASETARSLTIDVQNANAYSYDDNDEYLGSEQATPKASEFPHTDFERPPRQAPQFYTWEDFEQDERWHNAAIDHHAQANSGHSDATHTLPNAARDELEPRPVESLPTLPDSRPGSPYQPPVTTEQRGDRSASPDAARDELEPHAAESLPTLPYSRPGSPYEPDVKPEAKGGRSAKAIAAAAMLGGAAVLGRRAFESSRDVQLESGQKRDNDVGLNSASRGSYPLPAPLSHEATAVDRSAADEEEWPSMSRKSSKKKKGKGKSGSRQIDPPHEAAHSQNAPEPDRVPSLQPIETNESPTNEVYGRGTGTSSDIAEDLVRNSPVERVRTDKFLTGGRLAEDGVIQDHAAVQSFPSESHLTGEGDRKDRANEFEAGTLIRAQPFPDANMSSHIAGQPTAEDQDMRQVNQAPSAFDTEVDRGPSVTSTASPDGAAFHATDEVRKSDGFAAYDNILQVNSVAHAQIRELGLKIHKDDADTSVTRPEAAAFRQLHTIEADVAEQPKSQMQENPLGELSTEAIREMSDAAIEQPDEETWQPLPKKSKKGKKGNKSAVFDSGLSTPTEGPVAGLGSQGFPITSAIPADALYNAIPEIPDEQSDISWLPPPKKKGKKGKKEAQAAASVSLPAAEHEVVDEDAQDPGTSMEAFPEEPQMLENTLPGNDMSEMPSKKKGKKGKKAQRLLSYGEEAEVSPAYVDTSIDNAAFGTEARRVMESAPQPSHEDMQVNTPEAPHAPDTTDSLSSRPETDPVAWQPFSTGQKNKKGKKSKKVDFYEPADLAESPSTVPKLSEEEAITDRAERSLDPRNDHSSVLVHPTESTAQSPPWTGTETTHESIAGDPELGPSTVTDQRVDDSVSPGAAVAVSEHEESNARHLADAIATSLPYKVDDDVAIERSANVERDSDFEPEGAGDIASQEPSSGDRPDWHLHEGDDMSRTPKPDATSAAPFETAKIEAVTNEADRGGLSDLGGKKRKGKKGKRAVFDFAPDLESPANGPKLEAEPSGFDVQSLAVEDRPADDDEAGWRESKSGRKEQGKDQPSPDATSERDTVPNASREIHGVEPSVSASERRQASANSHGSDRPFAEPSYGAILEVADTDRYSHPEYTGSEDPHGAVAHLHEDEHRITQRMAPLLHSGVDQSSNMASDALEIKAVPRTPTETFATEASPAGLTSSINGQARTAPIVDAIRYEAPHHQIQPRMALAGVPEPEDLPPLPDSPTGSALKESFEEAIDHQHISLPLESEMTGEDFGISTHDAGAADPAVLGESVERAPMLGGKACEQQQTDHAYTVPLVEAGSATTRAAPADVEGADEEQFVSYPSFAKPSKKGKKNKTKGTNFAAGTLTESPANESATSAKPSSEQADGSDRVPSLVAGAAALTTAAAFGGDQQPATDRETVWPSASTKRSKKDKRKGKSSGFASPFMDQEPPVTGSAGGYAVETPELAAVERARHDGNGLVVDGERAISPDAASRPVQDIDFAATLAAGLADSGFDPDLVVNDSTFHRRATPPGTLPEADPEEFFQTRTSKRKKEPKQGAHEDAPAETSGQRTVEESSGSIEDVQMPDQPADGFDVDVTHSLQQSGFDPALLQQAISSHEATSSGVTEDDTGVSLATNRRKKKGKGGKAAAAVGLLGLATGILHGESREESVHKSPPDTDKEGIHEPHTDLTRPAGNADQITVTDEANASASGDPTADNDPAHTFNVAGDGELDVDEMDKAYSAFKKKDRRKKKKQKAVAEDADRAPALRPTTHPEVHSRAASRSRDAEDTESVRGLADTSIHVETAENVQSLSPNHDTAKRQITSMTSPTDLPQQVASYDQHGRSFPRQSPSSLPTPLDGPSRPTDRASQPAAATEQLQRERLLAPHREQSPVASPEYALRDASNDYDPADTTSAPREAPAHDDRHRTPAETASVPAWSFAALDEPHMVPESPGLGLKHHEIARDSGYQEVSTPILNRRSGESTVFKTPEMRGATSRESLRSRRSVEPLHIVTDTEPGWGLNVSKKRTLDETPDRVAMHSRTPSREVAATPLESTTKNRASYLFSSPPANLHGIPDRSDAPIDEPRTATSDYFGSEQHPTPTQETSSRTFHDDLSTNPLSPRAPLEDIAEESNTAKRSKDDADIGGPANVKAIRRTETPQAIRTSKERALSPSRPTVTVPKNTTRASRNPLSTDDLINRLPWPAVDDDNSTVNINRSLKRGTTKAGLPEARSPSVVSNVSNASMGQRIMSPGDPRSFSRSSNRSLTPTLRRIDRSLSGDLRAASRRGDTGSSVGARSSPRTIPFEAPPTPPSNDEDVIIAGAAGAAVMADVFQGYGDARGSQVSPTRPPSVRKRQSMHITDLESKLDHLVSENQALQDAKYRVERNHEATSYQQDVNTQAMHEELETRDLRLHEKEVEIGRIQAMLEPLREEIDRLNEINGGLTEANRNLVDDTNGRYATLQAEHAQAHEQWQSTSRDLDVARQDQSQLTSTMRDAIAAQISSALADKNAEIRRLREELDIATEQIRSLQVQIQSSKSIEFLTVRDEDYFDGACQKLCQHVQQWVLRFSKLSDNRACRLSTELRDDKIESRIDNAILDGSDVDKLLGDRIKRRDVFMSVVMTMVWEFVFTRYLFGMDREQRQKLKTLEKVLAETGPPRAIAQWRATTLTLLSKRPDFARQCALDTEAVAHEVFALLTAVLPPPSNAEQQLLASLQKVIGVAADLAIEMRTQRAEYIMLPPLQPEYDTNGDLVRQVHFNALLMNERSGLFSSNEGLEQERAVVKIVLFPLVVKKGDEYGQGEGEIVVCPAQVLVQNEGGKGKKVVRVLSGAMEIDDPRRSRQSLMSAAPGSTAF
ncbi:hypothetical protein B0A54_05814 [Friedmanniomyces endolithicus]|uniref:Involucrin repeat protein n=1 Tax=Friedmanniomyces endolithicus TaxID=329885 RepID=A0A4U0V4U4_9PEZI|nr:hypothetical protein B0A54_05814 [Friedmanniomyces endolithicus]